MLQKNILTITALAAALALAGCGGGGSKGYYQQGSSPNTPDNPDSGIIGGVVTNYHIVLNSSKPSMVITGDTASIVVKLVDVNGGGVVGENVTLAIEDNMINGVTIDGPSQVVTDESGNAVFNIQLNASGIKDKAALLNKGIRLNATFKDTSGKVTSQTALIQAVESNTPSQSAKYHLQLTPNKPTLLVTGDTATVTLKAVDENGGGIAGQTVTLAIEDTKVNRATIDGPSSLTTDALGNAVFNIILPRVADSAVNDLIASGIILNASITDENQVTSKQSTKLNVSKGVVEQPIGNITFGKASELQKSSDALYYTEALSAHVVDIDGKPLPNYQVTMTIDLVQAGQGYYLLKPEIEQQRTQALMPLEASTKSKQSLLRTKQTELANLEASLVTSAEMSTLTNQIAAQQRSIRSAEQQKSQLEISKRLEEAKTDSNAAIVASLNQEIIALEGRISQLNYQLVELQADLETATAAANQQKQQQINAKKLEVATLESQVQEAQEKIASIKAIEIPARAQTYCKLDQPVQLATGFVDPQGTVSSTFTYTTDATGKFNFRVQYLRQYASWQTVELKAKTNVSSKDINSSLVYHLGLLKSDFEADTGQPFDNSPYGENCEYKNVWEDLVK